ncbi:ciliogenesis and planar polarity effector 2-like [Lepeophtheirus salmonis]|uniref:ciliogenesis and planar polarity effector 2-like n=1 Tax=Lepeophtheirus salmonis TaxID=72036 RepID=UPI001AE18FE0|nr:ciliogenesis and planar polarity effector 2-like [Lepeophtheirus salmonis]
MPKNLWTSYDWPQSSEGQAVFSQLTDPRTGFPGIYGLLERPNLGSVEHIAFKISLLSKGADKSSFLGFLTGRQRVIIGPGGEVPGVRVTNIFWAAQTTVDGKVRSFKLSFWDSGDSATKRYAHIEPSIKGGAHAALLLYSGESGLREVEAQIERIRSSTNNQLGIIVVAYGNHPPDLSDLENKWDTPVHSIIHQSPAEASSLLHSICDTVWGVHIKSS